jgi:hypothetical protein
MRDCPQRPRNLGLALSSVLPYLPGGEERKSTICTEMEAAKNMPYRLLRQGLLTCGLLSTPAFELKHTSALKSHRHGQPGLYSSVPIQSLWASQAPAVKCNQIIFLSGLYILAGPHKYLSSQHFIYSVYLTLFTWYIFTIHCHIGYFTILALYAV